MSSIKYVWDKKTGDRNIIGSEIKCFNCEKILKDEEEAYYTDTTKKVFCKKCLLQEGMRLQDDKNTSYMWGTIMNEEKRK